MIYSKQQTTTQQWCISGWQSSQLCMPNGPRFTHKKQTLNKQLLPMLSVRYMSNKHGTTG